MDRDRERVKLNFIRRRMAEGGWRAQWDDVRFLLTLLATAERERDEARASVEAAKEIIRRDREFQEWAQNYLDSVKWAGHDRSDAIRQELLARDAELAKALADLDFLRSMPDEF